MRTLQLLRHAKSSWNDPALDDHDRPLSERGRAAAALVGARLAAAGAAPGLILCSTALRARETCEGVAAAFDAPPPCRYDERLYLASGGRILDLVGALGDEVPARVMAIGHDPGLRTLAAALAEAADPAAARKLRRKFATATLAEFDFAAVGWRELEARAVRAVRVATVPKRPSG